MNMRNLPNGLSPEQRCSERRRRLEEATGVGLSLLQVDSAHIGQADERNCEQMIGSVPLPVGIAGPLTLTLSSGDRVSVFLPLATTEAALVASVNRGCKALAASGGVVVQSTHHGVSRSIVLKPKNQKNQSYTTEIRRREAAWKKIGEATSNHLKILRYDLDEADGYTFLTIFCDTDEAMGMNMATIAAQAIGDFLALKLDAELITVAGNVDSDKKPSMRTHDRGRGFEVTASATLPSPVIVEVLKTTPERLLTVADAKLRVGSKLAGALGANLHAANIIAALYLALGQDAAHVIEGSLADTALSKAEKGVEISVRLPAILVGVRGGGTGLPAQSQCLHLLLGKSSKLEARSSKLSPSRQLAEIIGAAVLAGELSLLAAQASQSLASAHEKLARGA